MKASMPPSSKSGTCSVSRRSESDSYSTIAGLPSTLAANRPRSGCIDFARFVRLGDDGRRGLDPPAHGFENLFKVAGSEPDVGRPQCGIHTLAKDVVVLEDLVAQSCTQRRGHFDQAPVALPGSGIQQFLFPLLG